MEFKQVKTSATAKHVERKSSFFGYVYPLTSADEVKDIVLLLRKQHKKANHVAFAYRIPHRNAIDELVFEERASDDGEPSKTAGAPLLRLLQHNDLGNTLICVARVFGGIKLGPAGLIKAYGAAGKEALARAEIVSNYVEHTQQ